MSPYQESEIKIKNVFPQAWSLTCSLFNYVSHNIIRRLQARTQYLRAVSLPHKQKNLFGLLCSSSLCAFNTGEGSCCVVWLTRVCKFKCWLKCLSVKYLLKRFGFRCLGQSTEAEARVSSTPSIVLASVPSYFYARVLPRTHSGKGRDTARNWASAPRLLGRQRSSYDNMVSVSVLVLWGNSAWEGMQNLMQTSQKSAQGSFTYLQPSENAFDGVAFAFEYNS